MALKISKQLKYRSKKYSYDQFWSVHYTEISSNKKERDYKVIIKAKSSDLSKKILQRKIKEDEPEHSIKSVSTFMLRKDGSLNNLKINLTDWEHIHNAAFPNVSNVLFKYLSPRPKGHSNRFNSGATPKNSSFKEGHQVDVYIPPEDQKPYWIYSGKWKPWPKKDRDFLKEKIILTLSFNDNCRTKAAKALGYSRRYFYKLLKNKFVEIDWAKEYPPPRNKYLQDYCDTPSRIANIAKTWQHKGKEYRLQYLEEVNKLISQGKSIHYIANELKICRNTVKKCLQDNE